MFQIGQMYEDEALSHAHNFEWFSRFPDGRECVEDEAHTGWPHSVRMPETIKKIHELVTLDGRLTIRILTNELNISKAVVQQTLTQALFEQDLMTSK